MKYVLPYAKIPHIDNQGIDYIFTSKHFKAEDVNLHEFKMRDSIITEKSKLQISRLSDHYGIDALFKFKFE